MDTSKQYIKKCEKAWEIQAIKWSEPKYYPSVSSGDVWLPLQDQLQEMVENVSSSYELLNCFYKFVNPLEDVYTRQFTSMEQLWLAFVMKEKYGKTWDGEEWVNG